MKKIIDITDKEDRLIASLQIDWDKKEIEIIQSKDCKIIEGEAFA